MLAELLSIGSRFLNVILGGDADTSLSARVHIDGWRKLERIIDALFRPFGPNHCRKAWEFDVARARAQIARDEARQ